MLQYFDLDLEAFVNVPGSRTKLSRMEFIRRMNAAMTIAFCKGTTIVELDDGASGVELGFKEKGEYDDSPVAKALGWVKTGEGTSARYTLTWSFITAPLNTLFGVGEDPDVTPVELMVELIFTELGYEYRSLPCTAFVSNNVNRPEDEDPAALPGPDDKYLNGTIPQEFDTAELQQFLTNLGLMGNAAAGFQIIFDTAGNPWPAFRNITSGELKPVALNGAGADEMPVVLNPALAPFV
jgi:hypothetical protein